MIIDFHTHIFPPEISKNRHAFFEGEPDFKSLYDDDSSRIIGVEELIEEMDKTGVDKSVIFGFPWKSEKTIRLHNDYIMDSLARYSNRLTGFCCFGFGQIDPANEIERCITGGISGVGELSFYKDGLTPLNIKQLAPVMSVSENHGLPVLIHVNEPIGHDYPGKSPITISQIYSFVSQYPNNKIVLAHWGGGLFFYSLLKKEVRQKLVNVYFDTAASPFLYDKKIYQTAISLLGSEKILFGSDFPLISPSRYMKELSTCHLSRLDHQNIAGNNAKELLGI